MCWRNEGVKRDRLTFAPPVQLYVSLSSAIFIARSRAPNLPTIWNRRLVLKHFIHNGYHRGRIDIQAGVGKPARVRVPIRSQYVAGGDELSAVHIRACIGSARDEISHMIHESYRSASISFTKRVEYRPCTATKVVFSGIDCARAGGVEQLSIPHEGLRDRRCIGCKPAIRTSKHNIGS